jgi:hypothetical protein
VSGGTKAPCQGTARWGPESVYTDPPHCSSWAGPNPLIQMLFYLFKHPLNFKIQTAIFHCSKIYQTLQGSRLNYKEQLLFWNDVQITNRIGIKIIGSELSLNLG